MINRNKKEDKSHISYNNGFKIISCRTFQIVIVMQPSLFSRTINGGDGF